MSSNFSAQEYSELQVESNQVLAKLEQLDISEWQKKKDLIEKFVDVNRKLLDGGKISIPNKKEFCSYIVSKLTERNITVNRNGNFYRMFNSDEKGDQSGIQELDLKSKNISSVSGKTTDEIFRDKILSIPKKDTPYTRYLQRESETINVANSLNSALLEKYNESEEYQKILDKSFDEEKMSLDLVNAHAVLTVARDDLDDRNKLSNSQKCNLQFLINVGETKAEAAKRVGYCSKYTSLGIERSDDVSKYWEFLNKCLNCGVNEKAHRDLLIQKYLSGEELGIETPLKGY